MSSPEGFRNIHRPAEILQDSASYLTSAVSKPEHMKPLIEGYVQEVNDRAKKEIVDLSVQFKDSDGNPMEPTHVGTVQFNGWEEDSAKGKWVANMTSINAGGFTDWPHEGISIPLGSDCIIVTDITLEE